MFGLKPFDGRSGGTSVGEGSGCAATDAQARLSCVPAALAKRAQSLLGEVRAKLDAAQAEQATAANTAGTH